jgi:hypothetical protein
MSFVFANNATSFLMADVAAIDTEITINEDDVADFPTLGDGEQYALVLQHPDTGEREIMYVTGVDMYESNSFNVTRAQEGTVAQAFPANTVVALAVTAGVLEYLRDL